MNNSLFLTNNLTTHASLENLLSELLPSHKLRSLPLKKYEHLFSDFSEIPNLVWIEPDDSPLCGIKALRKCALLGIPTAVLSATKAFGYEALKAHAKAYFSYPH